MKGTITLLFTWTGDLLSFSPNEFGSCGPLSQLNLTATGSEEPLAIEEIQAYFPSVEPLQVTSVIDGIFYTGIISTLKSTEFQSHPQFLLQFEDTAHPSVLRIQRMKHVLDCAQIASWEWNVQTGETRFNDRWAEIVGYHLPELEPTDIDTWTKLAHPDDLKLSQQALEAHFNGEIPFYECEVRMRHKDGHWVWVRDYGRIVSFTAQGEPEWILGAHIDITGYKLIQTQNELLSHDLNMIMDLCPAVIYKMSADDDEQVQFITQGVEGLLNYRHEEIMNRAYWWRNHIHPEDVSDYNQRVAEWRSRGDDSILECEYRFRCADGRYIWLADRARIMNSHYSRGPSVLGSIIDITDFVSLNNHLQSLAKVSPAVLYQFEYLPDGTSRFPYASQKLKDMFGVTPEEAAVDSTAVFDAIYPEDVERVRASALQSKETLEDWKCEFRVEIDGKLHWLYGHSIPTPSSEGKVIWSGQIIDISEKKELELQLKKESTTDALTGAYNRRYFIQELHDELQRSVREKQPVSILAVDFDFFKQVNDKYGHDAGDAVLQQVTGHLRQHIRPYDTLARMGGEEFNIMLPNTDYASALSIANKLRKLVQGFTVRYHGQEIKITITLGVATSSSGVQDSFELLKEADRALYRGKASGRNCVH